MDTYSSGLAGVLFGQVRGSVLALLYGQPDKSFYVRQIARHVRASAGAVQKELKKLAAVDLIVREQSGNQVFYQINRRSPVYAEMRALVNKTVGVFHILRSSLEKLGGKISVAFVYGSFARQEETAQSDVDLIIVGDAGLDDVLACLSGVEISLGRTVNPTVYSMREFKEKLAQGNHFLHAVVKGAKVFLAGNEDELGKMAGIRMVAQGTQQRPGDQGAVRGRRTQSRRFRS